MYDLPSVNDASGIYQGLDDAGKGSISPICRNYFLKRMKSYSAHSEWWSTNGCFFRQEVK